MRGGFAGESHEVSRQADACEAGDQGGEEDSREGVCAGFRLFFRMAERSPCFPQRCACRVPFFSLRGEYPLCSKPAHFLFFTQTLLTLRPSSLSDPPCSRNLPSKKSSFLSDPSTSNSPCSLRDPPCFVTPLCIGVGDFSVSFSGIFFPDRRRNGGSRRSRQTRSPRTRGAKHRSNRAFRGRLRRRPVTKAMGASRPGSVSTRGPSTESTRRGVAQATHLRGRVPWPAWRHSARSPLRFGGGLGGRGGYATDDMCEILPSSGSGGSATCLHTGDDRGLLGGARQ